MRLHRPLALVLASTLAGAGVGVGAVTGDATDAALAGTRATFFDRAGGADAFAPTGRSTWRARLVQKTRSRLGPGPGSPVGPMIFADAPYAGLPHEFKVLAADEDAAGNAWYEVLLPSRPNGRTAWLPESALQLKRNPWRIRVSLSGRTAELLRNGRVQNRWRVAVGTSTYPTPAGQFAISEIVAQPNAAGFYGPYILTLTAHSTKLNDFDGGDGRVALHGTSLPHLLGTRASHGCVRLPNVAATKIARTVPAGTPVDVA